MWPLPSVCPHQPSDATATSGCGSTCVHVCIAPVSDPVDDDVVLADQNARAACHYLGHSLATPSHPRRRPLPLPAMPTGAASCFASPDDLRSVGSLPRDVGRALLGGGLGRLRLGGASNRCFVIVRGALVAALVAVVLLVVTALVVVTAAAVSSATILQAHTRRRQCEHTGAGSGACTVYIR